MIRFMRSRPRRVARTGTVIVLAVLTHVALHGAQGQNHARERARQLIERADAAVAGGRPAEAVTLLEAAERAAPDWPELKVNLAAARSSVGDYAGAAAAARAALALNPLLDGARFNLGIALLKAGDAAGAAVTLAPYKDAPAPAAVHAALGLAWAQMDRGADAAPVLQRSIDAGLRDREVFLAAGRAWLQLDDMDRARAAVRLLEAQAASWIQTRLLAGDVADAGQDWNAAATHYRGAIALQPDAVEGHYSLGLVLYKQREYDLSVRAFERALDLAPAHVSSHYYLALLELDRGNATRGGELLGRAATLAPNRSDVARDLGRARIDLGELDGAIESLRRAIGLTPDDASAWFLLGRALQQRGRQEEARSAFDRATKLNQQLRDRLQKRVSGIKR
jgi:tetratricopeptide (TPR) repeat protein